MGKALRLIALAKKTGVWQFGPFECDAELLLLEYAAGEVNRLLVCGGAEVRIVGESPALTRMPNGVRVGVATNGTSLLSVATTTALLQVLERL